jgi:hypothetical protein
MIGQTRAEITKAFIGENPGNIAAKRHARVLLEDELLFAIDASNMVQALFQPLLRAQKDKLIFYIAWMKQWIDAIRLPAEYRVIVAMPDAGDNATAKLKWTP